MDNKIYREIDIVKLFYHILQRWRFIIVCLIIGVVVLGGYSALKNMSSISTQNATGEIQNIKNSLSETRQEYVETTAGMIREYQKLVKKQKDYNDNAVFMQIDPYNVTTGKRKYFIDNYQVTEWNNSLSALVQAYSAALRSTEAEDKMGTELTDLFGVEENKYYYFRDLVKIETEVEGNGIFAVTVYGDSKESVKDVLSVADEIVNDNIEPISDSFGEHTVAAIGEEYFTSFNSTIRDDQLKNRQTVLDYENKIEAYRATITNDQEKKYLEYLLSAEQEDNTLLTDVEEVIEDSVVATETTNKLTNLISGKYIVVGALLGIIVSIILIIIKYACLATLRSCAELENTLRLPVLARFNDGNEFERKHKTKFDKWILSKKLGNKNKMDYADSIDLAVAKIMIAVEKDSLHKLCIATDTVCDGKYAADIIAKLDNKIDVTVVTNFLGKADALQTLSEVDGVILVEQTEVSRFQNIVDEIKICSKYNVNIIGAIVLE